jgi:DNA topoisomerase I
MATRVRSPRRRHTRRLHTGRRRPPRLDRAFMEPAEAARAASLRYVTDGKPGITRHRSGSGFTYRDPDGTLLNDRETIKRIRSLAIPPAWKNVWICPHANGHILATGRDARGRKQYRYHPRWRQVRDETKYERMILFAHTLPRIRARVSEDLARSGLPREKVLATIVHLLQSTLIRVGNEEYARNNGSYGLTTLRNQHVQIEGSRIRFRFKGKSGKSHTIEFSDRRMARLVRSIRDLPGQDLFQYLDESGEPQPISSTDVNDYLREISEQDFTAKDFRTWMGTLLAATGLTRDEYFETASEAKSAATAAIAAVADQLGNTPAISKKCYVHPSVLEAFMSREQFDLWAKSSSGASDPGLVPEENALLRYLEACVSRANSSTASE